MAGDEADGTDREMATGDGSVANDAGDGRDPVDASDAEDTDAYRGLFGAFRYALGASDSLVFRSYVVVAALLGVLVVFLVGAGVVRLVAATTVTRGGTATLVRAFYVLIGALVLVPLFAPVLFVARRHRRATAVGPGYDRRLALAGYLFVVALYVGLVVTVPPAQQEHVSGVLAPLVVFLYALPQVTGLVPPLLAALAILAVHRYARRTGESSPSSERRT